MSKQLRIWLFVLLGTLLTSTSLLAEGVITMTTTKAVGETIRLNIKANGDVTIDGVKEPAQTNEYFKDYTLTSQTITIRGDVTNLSCYRSQLTSLDLSGCTALTTLYCSSNQLTSLDVSGYTSLTELSCSSNQLTSLDVSGCTALTSLNCSSNQLTSLNASGCTALTGLSYNNNPLTSINLSNCKSLEGFYCRLGNLTSLDVSGCTSLTRLDCSENYLTSLDVSGCIALTVLDCRVNQLTSLDLSGYTSLKTLICYSNPLTSLNVSGCTALTTLNSEDNSLTKLNASGCSNLTTLLCRTSRLSEVNLSGCKLLKSFSCVNGRLTSLDVSGCTAMTELSCGSYSLTSLNVSGCTALTTLECANSRLTSLDVSDCAALTTLNCRGNQLTSLDVSKNVALTDLNCRWNHLTSLDLSKNSALTTLQCPGNKLTSLDLSKNSALIELSCGGNQLTSLDVSKNVALTGLKCSNNQLTSLDLSNNSALTTLDCASNLLRELNVSGCNNLNALDCYRNQIKGTEMANLVNSLPDRQGKEEGSFRVLSTESYGGVEGNVCLAAHVATAKAKNWRTLFYRNSEWLDYAGLDNPTFAVTYSSSRGGSIIITGADDLQNVPYDTELTVTETNVADGYKLTKLTANGQDILQTKRFKVTANTEVRATFTLQAYNVTTIKLGEGTLYVTGADDLEAVTPGTELTVTATPAEGYELTKLTANDKNILDTKKVVVNEDLIIKAIFSQKTFKVSLTKRGNGTIRAIGADDLNAVPYGTELTIEATPATGSQLTALVAGGINIIETKKVTIKKETTIEAFFTTQSFAVTLTKEGEGTISATGAEDLSAVDYGTELTIEATPATDYELTALTANGQDILSTQRFVVKGNTEVKATFTQKARNYAVTFSKTGEGTVTATGADDLNAVPYGTELTIEATPATGYELTALTANGQDILATKKLVVKANTTIEATFTKKKFAVTLTQEGEGDLDATGASNLNSVAYGTELTVVATPAAGYELTALTANGEDILATKKVVVTDNLTVKATFTQKVRYFAVSFTQTGEGTITATGASNLNAVPYGTELTVVATPAAGYELTALTANGEDILSTQRFVVKGDTEVKATFTKKVKSFAVMFTQIGEGYLNATGADDLDAVPYGTELTIEAIPATGYELTALTANGQDILSTQRFVVKGDTEVKATFTKKVKSFAVMFTQIGEGYLNATGADDLDAVPYGTELTIEATPATGYELTALTANGRDILSTKRFVVKGDTEVKATFTKKVKSFAVMFTQIGEGYLNATGADDLDAVPYGTELTITATPAAGYELTALTANGRDILSTKRFVVKGNTEIKATFTQKVRYFAVTFTQTGEGYLNATGADDLDAVPYGTELTIEATPATGYELTALTANGRDILSTKRFVVKGDTEIKATFTEKASNYAVTFSKIGEGRVTATGADDLKAVPYGTELTVVATPAAGYELTALTANGRDILATKKLVVKANTTIEATFTQKTFAVTLTQEGEGVLKATGAKDLKAVPSGTKLTIIATPVEGYELTALLANGFDILQSKSVVVTEETSIKAIFRKKTFAVTLTSNEHGTISIVDGVDPKRIPYGTELTITATPAEGYELTALTANGRDILSTKRFVVKGDTEVKATFAQKTLTVTLTHEGEGSLTATGYDKLSTVPYGTELTIVAQPKQGYELIALTANGRDILATRKVVVTENLTVKATFTQKTFAVTLTQEGEGVLNATGADDLKAVPYGTKLTITATPATGYELAALMANGLDILSTKSVEVTEDTRIKAIFRKKTFAVTLTSNEHGTISIVEPVDLDAVAYGTTLTVKATGKNAQCELTALTANGEDILATQSFVVKGATEVKATFVDHTGVETTVTQQTQLYPNPATDYVIVEGVAPASEVTLHSMTGERLYAERADSRGTLRIDLTPYADGVYLVCVAGETYRVVVRH